MPFVSVAAAGALAPLLFATFASEPPATAGPRVAAEESVAELEAEYRKAEKAWIESLRAGGRTTSPPPAADFLPRFWSIADAAEDQDEAVRALVWIAEHASAAATTQEESRSAGQHAVARLADDYAAALDLDQLRAMQYMVHSVPLDSLVRLYDAVLSTDPEPELEARARFNLAFALTNEFAERSGAASSAAEDLERAKAQLAVLEGPLAGTSAAQEAAPLLFEIKHLNVGQVAPEFAGEDVDGNAVALSQFRGRVVVLDFWGFW